MKNPTKEQVKKWNATYYQKNKADRRRRNNEARTKNIRWLIELKDVPCTDCGQRFHFSAMDFDHVRGEKLFEISNGTRNCRSRKKLLDEIAKCELVCANCHRVRTFNRFNRPNAGMV